MKIAVLNIDGKEIENKETFNNTNWDQVKDGYIVSDDNINEYYVKCIYNPCNIVILEVI